MHAYINIINKFRKSTPICSIYTVLRNLWFFFWLFFLLCPIDAQIHSSCFMHRSCQSYAYQHNIKHTLHVTECLLTRITPFALMHSTINPDCLPWYLHATEENSVNAMKRKQNGCQVVSGLVFCRLHKEIHVINTDNAIKVIIHRQ